MINIDIIFSRYMKDGADTLVKYIDTNIRMFIVC